MTRIDDIHQVSTKENNLLTAPYTEDEVRKTIFQMKHNKALALDGFQAEFYQSFLDIIKMELLEIFGFLHAGQI
jgi:hypothetical protein